MRTACIGMGANLAVGRIAGGHSGRRPAPAIARASPLPFVALLHRAGGPGRAAALRQCRGGLETDFVPRELLDGLLALEQEFGRDRSAGIANGPRTLDLDILLFGDLEINQPGLEIPHPAWPSAPLCWCL